MPHNLEVLYSFTKDNLRLQGMHYSPIGKSDTIILFIHGMAGNFIENYFANILGVQLSENGISFLYAHNRGHSEINNIPVDKGRNKDLDFETIGATYERFKDCEKDIASWIEKVKELGYKKIILAGHSLGGPKVINYLSKNKHPEIISIALFSPADMVGLATDPKKKTDYQKTLKEAKRNVKNKQPKKLLKNKLWDWYELSSQTFLDWAQDGSSADMLPIRRNPDVFPELSKISIPIFYVIGEKDSVAINSPKEDLELVRTKALACPDFTGIILPKANHDYEGEEEKLAEGLIKWLKKIL